jgi:hypothetical protein
VEVQRSASEGEGGLRCRLLGDMGKGGGLDRGREWTGEIMGCVGGSC